MPHRHMYVRHNPRRFWTAYKQRAATGALAQLVLMHTGDSSMDLAASIVCQSVRRLCLTCYPRLTARDPHSLMILVLL